MDNQLVKKVCDHQYKESFNFLFNCIEDYIFIVHNSGQVIQANRAVLENLEYSLDEITCLNFDLLFSVTKRLESGNILKGILSGELTELTLPICTKSGREIAVDTRFFKGQLEGNEVLYGISKEVKDVKRAKRHLEKTLGCTSSITALSKFDTGEYIQVNDVLVQTLGYERDEILGKRAGDLNIFLDPQFRDNIISQITEHGCVINCEVNIRDKIGNIHTGLFLAEMIEIADNKYLLTITNDITEKRWQMKEEQKRNNIQSLIEAMPFLAWVKDINGKYITVNKAYEDFYKTKRTELMGKTDFEIFPLKSALNYSKKDKEITKYRINQKLHRVHLKNKKYNEWFEELILPFFDNYGQVSGTIGVANNITAKVQLEMELANQKRFLKTIIDTIPDFIFYKDTNSKLLGCNKGYAERVLGLNEVDIIGKTDSEIVKNPDLANYYLLKDRETFASGKMIKNEEEIALMDGSLIYAETVKAPFWDDQGNLAGLIGISRDITKRKRLEKQLREKVEYAELLFKTVPSAVFSVDRNRRITGWNEMAEVITGYSANEVIGKECSVVLHGVGIEGCNLCSNACESPLINQLCNVVTKDGQTRHVLKSIAVVYDEQGAIREKIECFEDITEMTLMEEELRESHKRYSAIVNNAPQIVVIIRAGIILFVNEAGKEALGYDREFIGREMKEFMTKKTFEHFDQLKEEIAEDYCVSSELELIKQSGEILNVLLKGICIPYESERAFLAVMMDITESKQLNARLRESEEKFRQCAETINEIFLINDKEKIVYVSPAYERITGMSCQSLLDNPHALVGLIHRADRERMRSSFPQSFLNINKAITEEFRIIRSDGKMRWLWLKSYPVQDQAINSYFKVTSIVDITDRKKIEMKLLEREKQTQMEILLAERVQRDSLPHPFVGEEIRVNTIFEPYSTVSGDFFNYKWFDEQKKLCGYIIDVSGHGVATALQTATIKMMLDNVLLQGDVVEAEDILAINEKVMDYLYEDTFVALLYYEFDFKAHALKLISAGITLFLLAKQQECSLIPISGCYLGIVDNPEIEMKIIPFKPGELYCLMSDGASDLIELNGIIKQRSFAAYKGWLEKLAQNPERKDDFSVICIEILKETKEIKVLDINDNTDLEKAQIIISEFLERNLSGDDVSTLEVAVHEALNNGYSASGQVRLKLRRIGGRLIIRVKDFGLGFDVTKVQYDNNYEENFDELRDAGSGRGILLMKLFCDKVIYNAVGNEVLLLKMITTN